MAKLPLWQTLFVMVLWPFYLLQFVTSENWRKDLKRADR